MSDGGLDLIKQDMLFYLEKTFQFSFVFVGAVFAVLAGAQSAAIHNLACSLHLLNKGQPNLIAPAAIVLLDFLYLTLALSCAYAILKRAYFILKQRNDINESGKVLRKWETFTRNRVKDFKLPFWGVDNYFSLVVYAMVFVLSVLLCIVCIRDARLWFKVYGWVLLGMHMILLTIAGVPVYRLDRMCHCLSKKEDDEGKLETNGSGT